MASDLCRVALTGRLTKDSELRHTAGGTPVLGMRVAYSTRRKDGSGNWIDKSNYIDVTMFGARGEAVAQYLVRGKQVAVDGRLEWREWDAQDGTKRQAYEVVVDDLILLGGSRDGEGSGGGGSRDDWQPAGAAVGGDADFQGADDDIPF